jgi:hypothetical protein
MSDEKESEDYGLGMHIITITYHDDQQILPEVNLGDCSPWVAVTLLKAAMETLDLIIPPINISYNGDMIIEHGIIDEDNLSDED